ncbi:IS21 family transposase, partial [bacterium]|nr:IS21 family transposase [bacterium]
SRKGLSLKRYEEIERLLGLGLTERQIAFGLKCSRNTIKRIREGTFIKPSAKKRNNIPPIWAEMLDWNQILAEYNNGYPLKYIWNDLVTERSTSYVNFWRYFYRLYPNLKQKGYTHREYIPGERSEVDYAGDKLTWVNPGTGEVHEVPVFVGILCHSQRLFAHSTPRADKKYFFQSQQKCFEYFCGATKIVVPDNMKQAVSKAHWYDPDINQSYVDFCKHYGTVVMPTRVAKPQDKGLVEGAVKLVMRYFKWLFRNYTFTSGEEINDALYVVIERINESRHTRFKMSRNEKWQKEEKDKLIPLPETPYEHMEWKKAKVHPDCHVSVESTYYSAPFRYRGREVKVRISYNLVEIFYEGERIAQHDRDRYKEGKYVTNTTHLPPNSRAYLETTPQSILSQAKYINNALHNLINEMFKEDAIFNIRRTQGLIREARKEIKSVGYDKAQKAIDFACGVMKAVCKIRVPYFKQLLAQHRIDKQPKEERKIIRFPNNPNLRYHEE